ncbi:MAG: 2-C-methyl-D-erythritol 2,4-cyclodiphosphate synthase [Planctomycetaceae bacterium]|nr:2-C-methyl-D-erythritol 2,4-cyclodiphosphate synthase [Planctomycetaceae bacterium]
MSSDTPRQTAAPAPAWKVGLGHDTHRLVAGGPLTLGGLQIEHTHRTDGHSDADVLLHAMTDALLGAAGLGDIGQLFPNTDESNRNRDSGEMLQLAYQQVQRAGYGIVNMDSIVFAEAPPIGPHREAISSRVGELLGVPADCISIKAKTGEGVGPVGTREVIAAQCVALLQRQQE